MIDETLLKQEEQAIYALRAKKSVLLIEKGALGGQMTYSPKIGVVKDVVFFLASVTGGTERPQEEEIAQLEWLPFAEACNIVTFPTDTRVLQDAEEFLAKKE